MSHFMSSLVPSQGIVIGNPALAPFATALVTTLEGVVLDSAEDCLHYFDLLADPETAPIERIALRVQAETKVLGDLLAVVKGASGELEDLWDAIEEKGSYRKIGWSQEFFYQHNQEVYQHIQTVRQGRNEAEEAKTSILKQWPQLAEYLSGKPTTYLKAMRPHCLARPGRQPLRDLVTTARIVNNAAVDRMLESRRGVSKLNELTTGDWKRALTSTKTTILPPEVLSGLGIAIGEHGFLTRIGPRDPEFKGVTFAESTNTTPAGKEKLLQGDNPESSPSKGAQSLATPLRGLNLLREPFTPKSTLPILTRENLGQPFLDVVEESRAGPSLPSGQNQIAGTSFNFERTYHLPQVRKWVRADQGTVGPFKFTPKTEPRNSGFLPEVYEKVLRQWYQGPSDVCQGWEVHGAARFNSLFAWIYEMKIPAEQGIDGYETIGELADLEFRMYKHHSRDPSDAPNSGMLPGMVHSLIQQLVLQDPVLYTVIVSLRPDHADRLISFPYHAQFSGAGNKTAHCRLDFNLEALLKHGVGRDIVQCVVAFENEERDDATMVWPGMQNRAVAWLNDLKARNSYQEAPSQTTFRISSQQVNGTDASRFGAAEPVPLLKGGALFLLSCIPHGSLIARRSRKLVFPWFFEVLEGERGVEVAEADGPRGIREAHRLKVTPQTFPNGQPNNGGFCLPVPFYSSTHLTGLGPLSDALVGRVSHDDPCVASVKVILFNEDRGLAAEWVRQWRENAVLVFFNAFRALKWSEAVDHARSDPGEDRSFFTAMAAGDEPKDLPPDEVQPKGSWTETDEFAYPEAPHDSWR